MGGRVPVPGKALRSHEAPPPPDALLLPTQRTTAARYIVRFQLLTGPDVRNPRTQSKQAVGPRRTPQGRAVGGGRVPNPGHLS